MITDRKYGAVALCRRILLQARPYWPHIFGCLLLNLLAAPIALLVPVPLKIAVDSVLGSQPLPGFLSWLLPSGAQHSLGLLLVCVAGLLLGIALLRQLQTVSHWLLHAYTSEKLLQDFRAALFRHVQRLSLSYHDTKGTTDSTYRIHYDTYAIQGVTLDGVIPVITSGLTLLGMILVISRIDWQLALVALAVAPVIFVLTHFFGPPLYRRWDEIKQLDSSVMSVIQETLGAVRVVKAFGREDHQHDRFLHQSNKRVSEQVRIAFFQGSFDLLVGMIIAAGTAAALFVGISHVRSGVLTLGGLLIVMAYLTQLYLPLSTLSSVLTGLQSGLVSAQRAFSLFDELPEVVERPGAQRLVRAFGGIAVRNVSFSYDGGNEILHNISFQIPPGARVGLSGATGAGKTTLVNLIIRFYDPTAGQILLDGADLRDYQLKDLRQQFALMLQEPVLFSASIAENIAYARPGSSDAEIMEAAKLASADEFISRLPDRYQTLVGERGMRLSGGERQRISLARAFLRNAPILILDEPTSSVDLQTETAIMEAMDKLMRGRTTLMIAHRLSTLDRCDVRIHMEDGRIASADGNITYPALAGLDDETVHFDQTEQKPVWPSALREA